MNVMSLPTARTIPVYEPWLRGREREYVNKCLEDGWISSRGEFVTRFERDFSAQIGGAYSTSVSNGTVALHLALSTLGIGPGDEIIVPTLTYVASANAVAYVGATPVFVDAAEGTWNIDPEKVASSITIRTKAVMAVHLYGAPCDLQPLAELCEKRGIFLIEDAAEAFATKYHGRHVGTFGHISTFSFFGNKTITTGEGGMVVSPSQRLIERAAFLKSQSVSPEREYWHPEIGFNFRMTNLCAAIGVAQLEQADEIVRRKRALAGWYKADLSGSAVTFQEEEPDAVHSYWMVSILARDETLRDEIRRRLKEEGVETRPLFYPVHTLPMFKTGQSFPVAESLSRRGINLPSFPALSREQVSFICSIVRSCAGS